MLVKARVCVFMKNIRVDLKGRSWMTEVSDIVNETVISVDHSGVDVQKLLYTHLDLNSETST
jgi:hypothetical protein